MARTFSAPQDYSKDARPQIALSPVKSNHIKAIGKDFFWREIRRDDNYIEAMEQDLIEFNRLVIGYQCKLKAVEPDFNALDVANASQILQAA